jgi:hypothetical protein
MRGPGAGAAVGGGLTTSRGRRPPPCARQVARVLIRRRSRAFWRAPVALFGVLLFRTDFLCFVTGHLLSAHSP